LILSNDKRELLFNGCRGTVIHVANPLRPVYTGCLAAAVTLTEAKEDRYENTIRKLVMPGVSADRPEGSCSGRSDGSSASHALCIA
ncbi:hypothetical protein Q4595_23800, partial [Wenyingzhuangia sp. 1_MG-2023]|nr:hypothetical protein [Wenyingzhuangia sp. 1_MG-2023]